MDSRQAARAMIRHNLMRMTLEELTALSTQIHELRQAVSSIGGVGTNAWSRADAAACAVRDALLPAPE